LACEEKILWIFFFVLKKRGKFLSLIILLQFLGLYEFFQKEKNYLKLTLLHMKNQREALL